jgi:hypothetical protein
MRHAQRHIAEIIRARFARCQQIEFGRSQFLFEIGEPGAFSRDLVLYLFVRANGFIRHIAHAALHPVVNTVLAG